MENLIYWQGKAVGREFGSYTTFFPSAPAEAIAALSSDKESQAAATPVSELDSVLAALNAQMDAIPELAQAVENLVQKRSQVA